MIEPFRVLPWDFFADDAATAPPHLEALQISGAPRVFELLKRGARVYFRLHNDAARVWATLDDSDDSDFVRTFRRAIGSGRIGRVFERESFIHSSEFDFSLLISEGGAVQGREQCQTQWFELHPQGFQLRDYLAANRGLNIFDSRWQPPFREVMKENYNGFYYRRFDDAQRALTQMRWVEGDAETLAKFVAPFVWRRPATLTQMDGFFWLFFFAFRSIATPKAIDLATTASLITTEGIYSDTTRDLVGKHFRVRGVHWTSDEEEDLRGHWETKGNSITVKIPANPTAHEQLEAQLFLRDWLAGKLAPARIEEILNSLRPSTTP